MDVKFNSAPYTIKKEKFLQNLANTCNVSRSCRMAGVDRSDMYKLRKADPYFAEAWVGALEMGLEALEDQMHRRAFEGELITNQHGTYRKYSDTLAIFLMKAHKPEKYSDRYRVACSDPEKAKLNLDDPKIAEKLSVILNKALLREN